MRILIVEDDSIIGDGLKEGLELQGYAADWVKTKASAENALKTAEYDFIVLDLGLPDGSGVDLLTKLRQQSNDIPVLILTAYDDVNYRVRGLDAGADDYMIKPFDLVELCARIRALHRRASGRSSPKICVGSIELDPATHEVLRNGDKIEVGPKEFAILKVLMEKKGKILSKTQIEEYLYNWDVDIGSNTIEVHVHGLRKKLGKDVIKTIRHVGYQINADPI